MVCLPCRRGFHIECDNLLVLTDLNDSNSIEHMECCCPEPTEKAALAEDTPVEFDEVKRHGNSKDEIGTSAGRKRAAVTYKINEKLPCEWRLQKNCGGGKHPIIGCIAGLQKHIHHGPVKRTDRNERTNIHLICTNCHNRFHTLCDPDYDEEANELLPHEPVFATLEECFEDDVKWKSGGYRKALLEKGSD
jgi:hypothetical protein